MLEQLMAWLQSNPESAAATLASAGVPAPTGPAAGPAAGGMMAPMPTPRPEQPGEQKDMSELMKAFASLQPPTTARQPAASIQSIAPTFGNPMTGQFSQIMQQLVQRQLAHQQPMTGLGAAMAGRK